MSIYSWRVFITVAEKKSFVKAAEILNVTQSAVSHVIRNLEKEHGCYLFIRNRNNVMLTVEGKSLMPYVRNLMECYKALDHHAESMGTATKGEVRIATFNSAAQLWLPYIIKNFHKKYPDIRIKLRQTGDIHIRRLINDGEVDLAFLPTAYPTKGSFLPLHNTPLICLTPKDYVPINGKSITPEDLEKKSIILQEEGYDTEMMLWFQENGVNVDSDYKIEVDSTCHDYVLYGFGFCLTPEMTFKCNPSEVGVWPIDPLYMRTISLVTVYPDYISLAVDLFRKEIINYLNPGL